MTWTEFSDMYSGGDPKLRETKIYIEAPEEIAAKVFTAIYGRNPRHVTCSCCGPDYGIIEDDTLEEATDYARKLSAQEKTFYEKETYVRMKDLEGISIEEFEKQPHVKIWRKESSLQISKMYYLQRGEK